MRAEHPSYSPNFNPDSQLLTRATDYREKWYISVIKVSKVATKPLSFIRSQYQSLIKLITTIFLKCIILIHSDRKIEIEIITVTFSKLVQAYTFG